MKYIALWIAAICVLVFIIQVAVPTVTDSYVLLSEDVLQRPYTLVTSMFLHGGTNHLIFNMFALVLFGSILEKIISSKRFIILYLISGLIAGIGAAIFYPASLGASGAIFGVLGCLAVLRPRMTVYVGYIPMPMAVAAVIWMGGDLIGMFAPSGIANAAHLFGMGFGIAVGIYYLKQFGEKIVKKRTKGLSEKTMRSWERRWM